ncbi:MAG: MotA/TolQ/ExbB proton channel family protein, partial [Marinirhabdus sp.]|nr:MotA/TolQ/ExbB proton channel family protein [Marinirhabdus sp.]
MKKLFSIMAIAALVFAGSLTANATVANSAPSSVQQLTTAATVTFIQDDVEDVATGDDRGWHQRLKERFVEGGPEFMGIVLLCLIL